MPYKLAFVNQNLCSMGKWLTLLLFNTNNIFFGQAIFFAVVYMQLCLNIDMTHNICSLWDLAMSL
jgi:hypothetical protein